MRHSELGLCKMPRATPKLSRNLFVAGKTFPKMVQSWCKKAGAVKGQAGRSLPVTSKI
jgi:hypothetical protein